jgi:hypothetical protein
MELHFCFQSSKLHSAGHTGMRRPAMSLVQQRKAFAHQPFPNNKYADIPAYANCWAGRMVPLDQNKRRTTIG